MPLSEYRKDLSTRVKIQAILFEEVELLPHMRGGRVGVRHEVRIAIAAVDVVTLDDAFLPRPLERVEAAQITLRRFESAGNQ